MAQTLSVVICKLSSKTCSSFLVNAWDNALDLRSMKYMRRERLNTKSYFWRDITFWTNTLQSERGLNEQQDVCQSLGCSVLLCTLQ